MGFNVGALSFVKLKKGANKDEMFVIGYLIGLTEAFKKMASTNGINGEELEDVMKDALPDEAIKEIWENLKNGLELDLRSPEEVGVIVPNKED